MSDGLSRRAFLQQCSVAALVVPLGVAVGPGVALARAHGLTAVDVRLRSKWASGLPVPGPLEVEAPGDVRFLLVHHSASPNGYGPGDVPGIIRGFHRFHTGPDKGWPDVAYNFFVDRYGVVWEGREGSLAGPVKPSATGGSQGFAQICCFIGDHTAEPPTPEAQGSMVALLAALAERYGLDPSPGVTTSFVSRGSNRWPAGAPVTTPTIAGHRDMSLTACPGDAAYPLVRDAFPAAASALLAARRPPEPPPAEEPAPVPPEPSAASPAEPPRAQVQDPRPAGEADDGVDSLVVAGVGAGVLAAGAAAGLLYRNRRRAEAAPPGGPVGRQPE